MAAATDQEPITLPALALELRVSLDWLRREARRNAALRALVRRAGPTQFIEPDSVERVRELLRGALPAA